MGVGAFLVGAALIAGSSWYSADQSRRQAHEAEDLAREQAADAAEQAERLAKIQATKDKTLQEESEAIGKLDLGEEESARLKRARGKAAFKVDQQAATTERIQIGTTTPTQRQQGVQL